MHVESTTPATISQPIRKLCKDVAGDAEPVHIPVRTDIEPESLTAAPGWAVWQVADALTEAEFYVARRTPDGDLIAAMPPWRRRHHPVRRRPEAQRRRAAAPVLDRERRVLRRDPLIEDFITLGRKQFLLLNAGQPADPVLMRRLAVSQLIVRNMRERGLGGNHACLGNSGKRYKNCHGKAVRNLRVRLPREFVGRNKRKALQPTNFQQPSQVASAERTMAAANAQVGTANAAFYPSISLGASLAQLLFDAGRIRANLAGAQAGYGATVANYRRVVLTAMQEVEDGITGMASLERAYAQALRASDSAAKVLELATTRYEGGVASYLDLISAQQSVLNAQRQQAQLMGQRLLVYVFLAKALGGTCARRAPEA